jgi:amino-acid N-acetyltransferase
VEIEICHPDEASRLLDLLERVGLPRNGLDDHLHCALVACSGDAVVGCAAVECYGDAGLLRSVAVDATYRGRGIGGALVDAAVDLARRRGVRTLYLLTTSATAYFSRFGFRSIVREDVAFIVQQSVEFNGVCPVHAIVMQRDI